MKLWLESENRAQVTAAVAAIDSELANEPSTKGKELSEGLRKIEMPPLQVLFEVEEPDRRVRVVRAIRSS